MSFVQVREEEREQRNEREINPLSDKEWNESEMAEDDKDEKSLIMYTYLSLMNTKSCGS